MDAAFEISECVELIHPARFLFNAGQTPKNWNKKMLQDEHFKVLYYEENATNIFPNTELSDHMKRQICQSKCTVH